LTHRDGSLRQLMAAAVAVVQALLSAKQRQHHQQTGWCGGIALMELLTSITTMATHRSGLALL
jgi:hypothetical protein